MNQDERDQYQMMAETITSISEVTDPFQVFGICKHFMRDFTFGAEHQAHDQGMLGIFMLKSDNLKEEKRISVSNWSPTFVQERAKLNGYTHDPSIVLVAQANRPFTWQQGLEGADKVARSIYDLCEEHTGQKDGLMFPIADLHMLKGAASIGLDMSPDEFSPTQVGMIHHVFIAAYARLYKKLGPFPEDVEAAYSPKQRELIRLLALGYNVRTASHVMQCSENTAKYHLKEAMKKVGAKTQAQLIARSINKLPLS